MHPTRSPRCAAPPVLAALAAAVAVSPLAAQAPAGEARAAVAAWVELAAPLGHESLAHPAALRALPGWAADGWGNLVVRRGAGRPLRVVACALDRPGYAVTQITEGGYLRLHRVGSVGRHPLWDQSHEGQQVEIFTAAGPVPGVTAIANGHFAAQHRADTLVTTADDLWVDVGAESPAEVAALGIRLLDPLARRVAAWPFAEQVAGADAGARAGCAALAAAAGGGAPERGETVWIASAGSGFGWTGLGAVVARLGPVDEVTLLERGRAERTTRWARPGQLGGLGAVLRRAGVDSVRMVAPAVRHPGALVETVASAEAEWLRSEAARGGAVAEAGAWVAPAAMPPARPSRADSLAPLAARLAALADLPATPTHEWRVRDAIVAALPAWARARASVDPAGNLVVSAGPDRDTVVFVAHMDEVGYHVASVDPDGTVALQRRGGAVDPAWEGQPALLHFDRPAGGGAAPEPLRGIFVPRDRPTGRDPERMTAWFGIDGAALAARGVRPGQGVTMPKEGVRIGAHRFAGRAMDDRAGSTALAMALERIDPARLPGHTLFVWSVAEEGGLVGAYALAERLGPTVRRVYSIDTFVTSETPLESPHFAYVRLGEGPVLRAIENSSIAPPAERARVTAIAAAAGIPLQTGQTQGGTDGTAFTFWGAPNAGLSWPGRYSHTPAEVLDLRDLARLGPLIAAVAGARR